MVDSSRHSSPNWLRSRWTQEHAEPTAASSYHNATTEITARDYADDENPVQGDQRPQTPHPVPDRGSSSRHSFNVSPNHRKRISKPDTEQAQPENTHQGNADPAQERSKASPKRRKRKAGLRDSLEEEQNGPEEIHRDATEGSDGRLNELAMPDPVNRGHTRKDSWEEEKRQRGRTRRGQSDDDNEYLTEIAAPPPVDDNEHKRGEHEQDEEKNVGSPSSSNDEKKSVVERPMPSKFFTDLYTVSYLIFFSILGTLARLGVGAITRYPQAPFTSVVLWANVGGSLFMGFLAEDRRLFRQEWGTESKEWSFHPSKETSKDEEVRQKAKVNHGKVKKTIPLFIGLATGFCGSFTSFSSFMRDAFLALTNDLSPPSPNQPFDTTTSLHRNGGYSFEAVLATIIIEVACSISALHFGAHLGLLTDPYMPTFGLSFTRKVIDPLMVFLAFGSWLGVVFLSIFPPENVWRGRATFSLVFAPPGCLLRFYASKYLNGRLPSFPLGTFFVNIFGTGVLGMCYDLQHSRSIGALPRGNEISCQVLEGVVEGFCGCATTVSTWVAELTSLRRRHAYFYGVTSMGVGLGLLVVIMGSMGWSIRFGKLVCAV